MRQGGHAARQMLLVRVGRRRTAPLNSAPTLSSASIAEINSIMPISPAPMGVATKPLDPPAPGPVVIPLLPGERTLDRRVKFCLVQACTLASLFLGMTAIMLAIGGADPRWGAACLLACITFDGVDGALARKFGVASPFGVQMDSLGDMTSFGIAAPIVIYSSLRGDLPNGLLIAACAMMAACAAIRLARFNVSPKDGRFFSGVPTTMAATVLALGVLLNLGLPPVAMVVGVVLIAVAMVSSFPYAKLVKVFKLPPWMLLLVLFGAMFSAKLTFGLVVLAYLVSGPLLWLHQRKQQQPAAV
ncbi:CDP-diacylglycerol--serine O-phosphatidyltransferase [Allocatelliglobosispora scoriae]|uniref:CDP-diacylglycerol--serine O-phosphatidyltransferase n=1 Tax=Allocatelliglobosispora scoriae TaxID=643052 RepID=A0A841BY11_9ACTN|nr:CDP-alcohol phosphatidyltransferase family protein [Allocatelliglobosispora scoriae]MBB5871561.1 CDP-diacylglycerol--serine O-phosphatidyltransferase [Allocatelliglobosispora scoriae]